MADNFNSIFGSMLGRPNPTDVTEFPSPEELEYKILLKGAVSANYYDNEYYAQVSAKQVSPSSPLVNLSPPSHRQL